MKTPVTTCLFASLLTACGGSSEPELLKATLSQATMSATRSTVSVPPPRIERFSGARSAYSITTSGGLTEVTSKQTGLVSSLPVDIQRIAFADGTLVLDTEGSAGALYRVYRAAFGREPDAAGYGYWLALADQGVAVQAIAAGFVDSAEFRKLYGDRPGNAELLTRYYFNVLRRAPDPAGYAFWLDALNDHIATPVEVLAEISDSAENRKQVQAEIAAGIWMPGDGKLGVQTRAAGAPLAVGRFEMVDITGIPAFGARVRLGDNDLRSAVVDGMLMFTVPDVPAGAAKLTVTAGGQTVELPVTVAPTVLPMPPGEYVERALRELQDELAVLATTATGEEKLAIESLAHELQKQRDSLPSRTPLELRTLALSIAANGGTVPASQAGGGGRHRRDAGRTCRAVFRYRMPRPGRARLVHRSAYLSGDCRDRRGHVQQQYPCDCGVGSDPDQDAT